MADSLRSDTPPPQAPANRVWEFCTVDYSHADALAQIRVDAMEASLRRAGVWDKEWARARFHRDFDPAHTWGIEVGGELVGCIALRPNGSELWLEHFLITPPRQGQGIGSQVLRAVLDSYGDRELHLTTLEHSPAIRLYEKVGFTRRGTEAQVVVYMSRPAVTG